MNYIKTIILLWSIGSLVGSVYAQNAMVLDTVGGNRLKEQVELDEVVVSTRAMGTMKLRSSVLDVEKVSYAELCKAACCNLGESFTTNASVDVTYSDASTGARQIRLLGLSGAYVQMLTENMPNLRGLGSTYGLGYIPGSWMNSISISKGTSSVKTGYEAMTGQIDVEYKKPATADRFSLNFYGSSETKMELNTDVSWRINPKWSGMVMAHYEDMVTSFDGNHDGFMDMPMVRQANVLNRWSYQGERLVSQFGFKGIYEDRRAGQMANMSTNPYQIGILTGRFEAFAKNGYVYNRETNGSFALIASGSYHNLQSDYGGVNRYDAVQGNGYLNLIWEDTYQTAHHFSAGLSFNWDGYLQILNRMAYNTDEFIPGLYFQYTYKLDEKLSVLAGIRGDIRSISRHDGSYSTSFYYTPRMHIKYTPIEELNIRLTAGKGYRTAQVLSEINATYASSRKIYVLPEASQIDQRAGLTDPISPSALDGLRPESSWNFGLSLSSFIPVADKILNINAEAYFTLFENQVIYDMDTDPHQLLIYNLAGTSYSANYQIELSYPFFRGFTATAAFRYTDVKSTYNGVLREKPLTSRFKGLITLSYQTPLKTWQFDLTSQFNGGGRMPDPYQLADGTDSWDRTFPFYVNMQAQITKYFKDWSIYIGAENLLNYHQPRPIIGAENPYGSNFDTSMVWGPVAGIMGYVGVRYNLPYKNN